MNRGSGDRFSLPDPGKEAVADRCCVGRPSGIVGEYPLLGPRAVEKGRPTSQHQQRSAKIPFLKIVPDVSDHVGQIHGVAYKPVGDPRHQAPQGREDPEPSAQADEAGEAETGREQNEDKPAREPHRIAGHPAKVRHLGVRVGICNDYGGA